MRNQRLKLKSLWTMTETCADFVSKTTVVKYTVEHSYEATYALTIQRSVMKTLNINERNHIHLKHQLWNKAHYNGIWQLTHWGLMFLFLSQDLINGIVSTLGVRLSLTLHLLLGSLSSYWVISCSLGMRVCASCFLHLVMPCSVDQQIISS